MPQPRQRQGWIAGDTAHPRSPGKIREGPRSVDSRPRRALSSARERDLLRRVWAYGTQEAQVMGFQKLEPRTDFFRFRIDQVARDLAGHHRISAIQISSAPGGAPFKVRLQVGRIPLIGIKHSRRTHCGGSQCRQDEESRRKVFQAKENAEKSGGNQGNVT